MTARTIVSIIGAVGALLLAPSPADAHARLVRATPATGATVASPRIISLTFSERLAPAFSGFDLSTPSGAAVTVRTRVSADGRTISGRVARRLAPGAYTVNWRIASTDGHRMTGATAFVVR